MQDHDATHHTQPRHPQLTQRRRQSLWMRQAREQQHLASHDRGRGLRARFCASILCIVAGARLKHGVRLGSHHPHSRRGVFAAARLESLVGGDERAVFASEEAQHQAGGYRERGGRQVLQRRKVKILQQHAVCDEEGRKQRKRRRQFARKRGSGLERLARGCGAHGRAVRKGHDQLAVEARVLGARRVSQRVAARWQTESRSRTGSRACSNFFAFRSFTCSRSLPTAACT